MKKKNSEKLIDCHWEDEWQKKFALSKKPRVKFIEFFLINRFLSSQEWQII